MLQGDIHGGNPLVEELLQRGGVHGGIDTLPQDGEDGALHWLGHGLVGLGDAGFHCGGEVLHIGLFQSGESLGDACEYAREDDSGVAAGAEEHSVRHGIGHFSQARTAGVAAGLDGHKHIVAGVSVRDGEDIKVVYGLAVLCELCGSSANQVKVQVSV